MNRVPALRRWLDEQQEKDSAKTQEWLAAELRISSPFLSQLLSGQRTPSLELSLRIEAFTGIPPRELVVSA
jgi:transcriptional regulator with XRE-family HTH domain